MKLSKKVKLEIIEKVIEKKFTYLKENKLKKEIGEQLRIEIQKDIIDGYEKYLRYIQTTSTIKVFYKQKNNGYGVLKLNVKQFPWIGTDKIFETKNYKSNYKIISKKVEKLMEKYIKFQDDKIEFKNELLNALKSINTDNQLKKYLPNLFKYLPLNKNCGIIPIETFNKINTKLKNI